MNALTAANSGESIEVVVELIKSRTLSDSSTVSWFNHLYGAQHPTKEAVVAASVRTFIQTVVLLKTCSVHPFTNNCNIYSYLTEFAQ